MKLNTGETGPEEFDAQREQLMIQDRRGDMVHRVPRDREWCCHCGSTTRGLWPFHPYSQPAGATYYQHPDLSDIC
jgi:hypothetical protein